MTSRSESKCFTYVKSGIVAANEPVSVGTFRTLADNALHLGDSCGRVLINTEIPSGWLVSTVEPGVTGGTYKIASFGPFRLTVDENGVAYPIRVRLYGSRDGKGSDDVLLIAHVHPVGVPAAFSSSESRASTSTTNSTTASWLTTSTDLISLTAYETARCAVDDQTSDDGTTRITAVTYRAMITVYGKRSTGTLSDVELRGIYAAEFVGA